MDKGIRSLKLIVVGSCGVGKTALISALQKRQFNSTMSSTISPASFNTKIKTSQDHEVTLQIWDTAGQEKYQSISKMFYRDSDICFVCYDHWTVNTVEQWVKSVREEVPNAIIFLVQTKRDLAGADYESDIQKGYEMMREFNFVHYYFVSSLTGQCVDEVFLDAALLEDKILCKEPMALSIKEIKEEKKCC